MKFDHMIKFGGIYYAAGEDVPMEEKTMPQRLTSRWKKKLKCQSCKLMMSQSEEVRNQKLFDGGEKVWVIQTTLQTSFFWFASWAFNDEEGGSFSESLLKQKIKSAIREVRDKRRYPLGYTDGMIAQDLDRYYSQIRNLALYDYNSIGFEGESQHSEDSIQRTMVDRKTLFAGIIPLATV